MNKLTKAQHLVALLIMLPSIPFALPLSLLVLLTRWASIAAEDIYDCVGTPFLYLRRLWLIRCDRVNALTSNQEGNDEAVR